MKSGNRNGGRWLKGAASPNPNGRPMSAPVQGIRKASVGAISRQSGDFWKSGEEYTMTKPRGSSERDSIQLIDPNPKGELKRIGGSLAG